MTAQIHERLILNGEEVSMAFCPPIPDIHPRIYIPDHTESITGEAEDPILQSTACWRGYQGTWEIKAGRLYLVDLRGGLRLREGEPVLADWFSGVLRIPKGEMLQYVHMGFGSVFEQEVHIKIESGVVVKTRLIDIPGHQFNERMIERKNFPGNENRFPGDDEL